MYDFTEFLTEAKGDSEWWIKCRKEFKELLKR